MKSSCKGVQKRRNLDLLVRDEYLNVLMSRDATFGCNRGFRVQENKIATYTQQKVALSYLYFKRIVQQDGISTKPLLV